MAYENATCTAPQDRQVVDETIAEVQSYLQLQAESAWCSTWEQQGAFIAGLFDRYAPETSLQGRLVGQMLGAAGLANVAVRYGTDEHHPKFYGGSYEKRALATYHHLGHSSGFIENAFIYASRVNQLRPGTYDEAAFVRFPIIGAFHDSIIGNGRGNDERQSAMLSSEMMMRLGFSLQPDEPVSEGTLATAWNPTAKQQSIDPSRPHYSYQVAAGVADLLPLFDRRGPYYGICSTVEDMTKKMHGQILTKTARESGFSLIDAGVEDCLDFIDTSDVLRQKYAALLIGQTGFFRTFNPADPGLDELFSGRPANVSLMNHIATAYVKEEISAKQTLTTARDYMLAA